MNDLKDEQLFIRLFEIKLDMKLKMSWYKKLLLTHDKCSIMIELSKRGYDMKDWDEWEIFGGSKN